MIRVALDATALLGPRAGVGVFTAGLLDRLGRRRDLEASAYALSWRGRHDLPGVLPPGVRAVRRPLAAGLLGPVWARVDRPTIEWWTGPLDVVHGLNFVVPPARSAAEVVTVHDLTTLRFPELASTTTRRFPDLVRRAVRRGAWVHTVSDFVADEVRSAFPIDADRVVTVANGVDPLPPAGPTTDAAAGRRRAGSDHYVLALGTVEPRKDLPALVAAFDGVAAGDTDVRLVIAGPDGWGADALAAAVAGARHRDRIVRLGWVADDERAALLRGATVFAYPSRYEGFGLPPLEAMAAGVPVLATTAGALPEVVGKAAELVEPGDTDALVAALAGLLSSADRRDELVAAGRQRVARYSWDACAEGLVDLYQRAVGTAVRT